MHGSDDSAGRNMLMPLLLVAVLALLPLSSCADKPEPKGVSRDRGLIIKEIGERNRTWGEALVRLDTVALLSMYTPDVMLLPPNGTMMHGHAGVLSFFGALPELGLSITTADFSSTRILGSDSIITEIGTYVLTLRSQTMMTNSDTGKYITIWQRSSPRDPLRIYATIWNTSIFSE